MWTPRRPGSAVSCGVVAALVVILRHDVVHGWASLGSGLGPRLVFASPPGTASCDTVNARRSLTGKARIPYEIGDSHSAKLGPQHRHPQQLRAHSRQWFEATSTTAMTTEVMKSMGV